MRTMLRSWMVLAMVAGMAGCGDDDRTGPAVDGGPPDATGIDGGVRRDAGRDSGPRRDSGSDPCSATGDNAADSVGCNDGIRGPQPDNLFGGACDVSDTAPGGSCTDEEAICWRSGDTGRGVCISPCTPSADTYVSTGSPPCPQGSRCFDFGEDGAYCFPDCEGPKDCSVGECDGEASCVGGGPDVMPDGGMMDAGTDAGTDAGLIPDAGTIPDTGPRPDVVLPVDAGMAPGTENIDIVDSAYSPMTVTVSPGTMVVWTHRGAFPHTVTSDTGLFGSGMLNRDDTFSHTFAAPGTYRYHCMFHGAAGGVGMSGTITVAP
jgi:plastocyanin